MESGLTSDKTDFFDPQENRLLEFPKRRRKNMIKKSEKMIDKITKEH